MVKKVIVAALVVAVIAAVLVPRMIASHNSNSFKRFVRSRIEQDHPGIRIVKELDFGWNCEIDGNAATLFLDNIYATCQQQPEVRDELVEQYLRAVENFGEEQHPSWEEARTRLLPVIKPQEYRDAVLRQTGEGSPSTIVGCDCRFGSGLCILLAVDSEQAMCYVTSDDLKQWQRPKDELLKVALDNLAARTTEEMWRKAVENAQQSGFVSFETGDCYDAARLLLPDFYSRASRALRCHRLAVIIPDRDVLFAVSADSAPILAKLKVAAEKQHRESGYPITPDVIYLPKE